VCSVCECYQRFDWKVFSIEQCKYEDSIEHCAVVLCAVSCVLCLVCCVLCVVVVDVV
jgi:hypothetical protein